MIEHPQVAFRDCRHCEAWQYNEETGKVEVFHGHKLRRRGKTPCRTFIGCPKGTPENPVSLRWYNVAAYSHYTQCRATGIFPEDSIVRRNSGIISEVERQVERVENMQFRRALMMLATRVSI